MLFVDNQFVVPAACSAAFRAFACVRTALNPKHDQKHVGVNHSCVVWKDLQQAAMSVHAEVE